MTVTKVAVRTVDELLKSAINTYRSGLIRRGVSADVATRAVAKGTPIEMTLRAVAEMMGQVYANERAVEDAQMPDSAVGEDLDRLAGCYGIVRLPGAGAAGDVVVTCSGSVTYAAGAELVANRNGKRYQVVASDTVASGGSVGVIGVDVGKATNLPAGEVLTWVSPPGASAPTCVVGIAGITNGQEPDNDARLRARLAKRLQSPPGGGNWPQLRQWTEEASAGVEEAFVYPAVHGPGTVHVAFTIEGTADNLYHRAAPAALVELVRAAVLNVYPQPADVFVSTVVEQAVSAAIKLGLPDPASAGGDGGGWLDATPWPTGPAAIASIITASTFGVLAQTAPAVGKKIAIWDSSAQAFRHATVLAWSGTTPNYTITIDAALPTVDVNALVSPDAENLDAYGRTLCERFALLGPGQRTASSGRLARHPAVSSDDPAALSPALLTPLALAHGEITAISFMWSNGVTYTTPPNLLPPAVTALDAAPNIWRLTQIGFYKS